jgi:hypothetical protein
MLEVRICLVDQELIDRARIVEPALQGVRTLDLRVQPGELRRDLTGTVGVIPERWIGGVRREVGSLGALALYVKGTPSPPRCARRCDRVVRCGRSSGGHRNSGG